MVLIGPSQTHTFQGLKNTGFIVFQVGFFLQTLSSLILLQLFEGNGQHILFRGKQLHKYYTS